MSSSTDIRKLENKTYLYYHQDGLLDLIIGAIVFGVGLNEATDTSIWSFITLLLILSYVPMKNRITFPRLGYVKFKNTRGGVNLKHTSILASIVLTLVLVGILLILRLDNSHLSVIQWIRKGPLLLYGLLGLIGFSLFGLLIGLSRLHLYALLSGIIFSGGHLLNLEISLPFFILAGAILTVGTIFLIRFVQKYPVITEEAEDDSE
jgi:hypothetical protein